MAAGAAPKALDELGATAGRKYGVAVTGPVMTPPALIAVTRPVLALIVTWQQPEIQENSLPSARVRRPACAETTTVRSGTDYCIFSRASSKDYCIHRSAVLDVLGGRARAR
jgi:hypothetical protein